MTNKKRQGNRWSSGVGDEFEQRIVAHGHEYAIKIHVILYANLEKNPMA